MLKIRVIPILLIDGFSVLKTIKFETRRNLGSPITAVQTYNTRNIDEMIILDIDASRQSRDIDLFNIKDITEECFMPLTIGGGIRSLDMIRKTLLAGADKVSLNTISLEEPEFISEAASIFGRQCIVSSIDYIDTKDGKLVYNNKTKTIMDIELTEWAKKLESRKSGELLINSVSLDGTMTKPDYEAIASVANCTNIPIISAGGISSPGDCAEVIKCGVGAVAVSSLFHFTSFTPECCRLEISKSGFSCR